MEWAANGSLRKFLKKESSVYIPQSLGLAKGIADGVRYLHDRNYIHRDLKCDNVVITIPFTAKICDLGSAVEENTPEPDWTGTPAWMPPEAKQDVQHVSKAWDVYSYGIVLWELLTHKLPTGVRPDIPVCDSQEIDDDRKCHDELTKLMKCCWEEDYTKRTTTILDIVETLRKIKI